MRRGYEQEQAYGGADDRCAEAGGGRPYGRGRSREYGVSKLTIYAWKAKYGGLEVNEARRLHQLEDENSRLKRLVADLSLDREMLKAVIAKNGLSS